MSYSVTILDARKANPGTLSHITEKPRQHAALQGASHRLIWLIQPWQKPEFDTLGLAPRGMAEEVRVGSQLGTPIGEVGMLLDELSRNLQPDSRVAVISYDHDVTAFVRSWRGPIAVDGLRMVDFRAFVPRRPWTTTSPTVTEDPGLVERALADLVAFFEANGITAENPLHITTIAPMLRARMPELRNSRSTGLTAAVVSLGVRKNLLGANGGNVWRLPAAAAQRGPCTKMAAGQTDQDQRVPSKAFAAVVAVPQQDAGVGGGLAESTKAADDGQDAVSWLGLLRIAKISLGARSYELMCQIADGLVDADGRLVGGEVTRYELQRLLEQKLYASNVEAFRDAERKIVRNFLNRLTQSKSLLDASRQPVSDAQTTAAIAYIDRKYRDVVDEWVILTVARGEPQGGPRPVSRGAASLDNLARLVYGSGAPKYVRRMEAAMDRLVEKRMLIPDAQNRLHAPRPMSIKASESVDAA